MKIDPLNFILNKNTEINKKFILISGNEITLMNKVKDIISNNILKEQNFTKKEIDNINNFIPEAGLFNSKCLHIVKKINNLSNEDFENLSKDNDVFLFITENNPRLKSVKNIFLKRDDAYLIECYELSKESKIKILQNYCKIEKISLAENFFWELIEKLDNRYYFLENDLHKLEVLRENNLDKEDLNKIISENSSNAEGVFFEILNKNAKLINIYNQKITNSAEVNSFYYAFRQFCFLIINNNDEVEFTRNVPRYLFREKNFLISIYKKYNIEKKVKLLNLLYNTEILLRKNNDLSVALGLRFLLSFKKLTIS